MPRKKKLKSAPAISKKPFFDLEDQTKKAIFAILFFSFAVIISLSIWHLAGPFGEMVFRGFNYLFGWGYFVLPVVFLMMAFEFLKSRRKHIYFATIFGAFSLFISILGILEMSFSNNYAGLAGYVVAISLNKIFGFWASLVLLISFVFISLIMTLNIPLRIGRDADEEKGEEEEETIQKAKDEKPVEVNPVVNQAIKEEKRLVASEGGKPSVAKAMEGREDEVEMGEVNVGPAVTQYTLRPAQGVKLSKIVTLHNDLALALAAHPLRIEAPIPGKALIGVEVPNKSIALVRLGSLLGSESFEKLGLLNFALGRDVSGMPIFADLSKMPHLLIAGATGAGKSVCIHTIITSLIWRNGPSQLKFILIDPKRVELAYYRDLPHLLTPVISDGKKSINALRWAVKEMERRYEILSDNNARDIVNFNNQVVKNRESESFMPYLIIIIDELADLMAAYGREVEGTIIRIAQMARAVGIHLIVSTQRPSVEVLTGLIKANITTRIALQVPSQVDSRTILDMAGAEKLLGNGDMLYMSNDSFKPRRLQGVFISDKEIKRIANCVAEKNPLIAVENEEFPIAENNLQPESGSLDEFSESIDDELFEEAKEVIFQAKKASASLLQRRLRVGYARAARLLDILEEKDFIGPGDGAKPREVYLEKFDPSARLLDGQAGGQDKEDEI
ncbi:MAG: DNA translocase FtsK 4TM domain-containing protein [Candidatus Azambacteria bacterium]|nr:DNA translocase FtsK 4TM domain-containing protein [Candidatus Azambacteria bacterium]